MIKKDYLLRQLQTFLQELKEILLGFKESNTETIQIQLNSLYKR